MSDQSLSQIDLNKYYYLMSGLLPALEGLALCDENSKLLQASHGWKKIILSDAIALLNNRVFHVLSKDKEICVDPIGDKTTLYSFGLNAYSGDKIGTLLIGIVGSDEYVNFNEKSLDSTLLSLKKSINEDIILNNELFSIADELTLRYEELNLVYETDDENNKDFQGRKSLQRLVNQCTDYLNVDLAVLLLPSKKITLLYSEKQENTPYLHSLISKLETVILPKIKNIKQSIVVNDNQESILSSDQLKNYKFIASPILQVEGEVLGVLSILKHHNSSDFTNSTRNLMEVMARKVSKIIVTNYDTLTGLVKRQGFENELKEELNLAKKVNHVHCVLNLNIDRIHIVNDVAGHQAGDDMIKETANLLSEFLRDKDIVARIGGDEFGVIMKDCPLENGIRIAESLRIKINELEFIWNDDQYEVSASIGLIGMTGDIGTIDHILAGVEVATKSAKDWGGNRVQIFNQEDHDLVQRRKEMHLFKDIRDAFRKDRFELFGQFIEPLQKPELGMHLEILLRMIDADNKLVSPGMFMPAAERYYMMPNLDRWVVENSLKLIAKYWRDVGEGTWSINLSGQSLGERSFLEFLRYQVTQANVPADNICFEITETMAIKNLGEVNRFIVSMKEFGCRFSLDDFGSGLSSFTYLRTLDVDYLKIDGSFVKGILEDPVSEAMVSSINRIGHIMGLKTIAEFVENDDIKKCLKSLGVDYGQGFGIARPRPLEALLYERVVQQQDHVRSS
ncbi:MAG: EAL domain-containing protein [Gammaproteobacteria bacterium]|nr:EAL domain-containing protein [Gammaproteobacteria bacterium]